MKLLYAILMLISAACHAQAVSIKIEYDSPSDGETTCREAYLESISTFLYIEDCDATFDRISVEGTDKIMACAIKRKKKECAALYDGSLDREEIDIFEFDAVYIFFESSRIAAIRISRPKCE